MTVEEECAEVNQTAALAEALLAVLTVMVSPSLESMVETVPAVPWVMGSERVVSTKEELRVMSVLLEVL